MLFRSGRDQGQTLGRLAAEIKKTIDGLADTPALDVERAALGKAAGDVQALLGTMMGKLAQSVYHVGLQGNRILFALAELVIGWRLVVNARVASGKLAAATGDDKAFYQGKLAAARWYAKNVLPGIGLTKDLVAAGDLDLMELPDEAL